MIVILLNSVSVAAIVDTRAEHSIVSPDVIKWVENPEINFDSAVIIGMEV